MVEGMVLETDRLILRRYRQDDLQNVYFRKDDQGIPIWKDTFVYSLLKR